MVDLTFGLSRIGLVWIYVSLLWISIVSATVCPHCGKDFVSLGRHTWRCQSRITGPAHPAHNFPVQGGSSTSFQGSVAAGVVPNVSDVTGSQVAVELVTCVCGRECKGRRGLVAHQRTCRAFHDLLEGPTGNTDTTQTRTSNHQSYTNRARQVITSDSTSAQLRRSQASSFRALMESGKKRMRIFIQHSTKS